MPKTPIHVYTRLNKLQFVNRAVLIDLLIFFISFIKKTRFYLLFVKDSIYLQGEVTKRV